MRPRISRLDSAHRSAGLSQAAFSTTKQSHPRQWVDRSSFAYKSMGRLPPPQSHPRKWVDRSSSAYNNTGRSLLFRNPTHGSGWIVQALPTTTGGVPYSSAIPPTEVGGSFKLCLQQQGAFPTLPQSHQRKWVDGSSSAYNNRGRSLLFRNPTHGSGWIVQALPTKPSL